MGEQATPTGPDLSAGVALADVPENGTLAGRVGEESVLLSRFGEELFAISGTCTHYGGQLGKGVISSGQVRCPLHHACFDLKTGAVRRAPALDPLDRWRVERDGDRLLVREKIGPHPRRSLPSDVANIVIVGGGAAGLACANELRHLGYQGAITMLSADADPPCDRPNLSKDYLAGNAPEEWIPLRPGDWYRDRSIDLRLESHVRAIDAEERFVELDNGERIGFDRLLLATGSEPRRLQGEGWNRPNVFTLRSLADARAIIACAKEGARAAVIGASFIGMEAAAALTARGVHVAVIGPEKVPFERQFGAEVGRSIEQLHEEHGVTFHLGTSAAAYQQPTLTLANGQKVPADFVIIGVGVVPRTELAEAAGLHVDNGVVVDEHFETSAPGIFAAGDIAAFAEARTGERVRIEHWVVAEQHGQVAAANMLGLKRSFHAAPFFWTEQFGVALQYVGHAPGWDELRPDGEIAKRDFIIRYYRGGKHLASASIDRYDENLQDELSLEAGPPPDLT
jgi:NADPH-dependent 2,4-dienoyl-CoA reductase/sulfur reductase-like enzyme/nitrite reductase/ring-hydroxylating ferredoxin subunit